jgi:integrase
MHYLYPRVAEVRALEWSDVDLDHAAVFIHRAVDESGKADSTKGRLPRRFAVEAELLPLLRALRADAGGLGNVFAPLPVEKHLAPMLRRDLERAGVTRIELFTGDQNRKRMTFHDLRATGITWMAIRGDEPLRIQHRAGHKQFGTTQGYIREAEQLRDGFGEVFPPLPADVVSSELAPERLGLNGHVYRGQPQTEPPPADRFVRSIVRAAR